MGYKIQNRKFISRIPQFLIYIIVFVQLNSCSYKNELSIKSTNNDWIVFQPDSNYTKGIINMENWLDKPAGKHGFVQIKKDKLIFEDGTPVKFWGVNICSHLPYSDSSTVEKWANYLSKYGVNAVRFHKFSSHAINDNISTELDPDKFKRFDYFQYILREKGIYYGWSHIYGHNPKKADSVNMLNYSEIKSLQYPWSHLNSSTSSLVNFAPDLQNISIALTVNMLNHVNPYTGLRYADDPALSFIEFQNEDNIFWSAIEKALEQAPTYKKLLCNKFSDWLKKKYKSNEAIKDAWGIENVDEKWDLAKGNYYPQPNHSYFQNLYEQSYSKNIEIPQHALDKMQFLFDEQIKYYEKFTKAIRETGYKGTLVSSCWQAGIGPSHYYNLYADYITGVIDRHNYAGGSGGHRLKPGKFNNNSMLSFPGSGLLNTGMQMVADRPFAISEWMSLIPTEWTVESGPILAYYGLGLQGWDASYAFASSLPYFTSQISGNSKNIYNVNVPSQIGLYPILARSIYRNDIKEGELITTRNVHIPSLEKGKLGFYEHMKQDYDIKYLSGDVSPLNLAAGKVAVNFTDSLTKTFAPSSTALIDTTKKTVKANTGELIWNYKDKGLIQINSKGTKGIIGFPEENMFYDLGDLSIRTNNDFAIILLTAKNPDKTINNDRSVIVASLARSRNTGMKYNEDMTELLETGSGPIKLETVDFDLQFKNRIPKYIKVLDHMGRDSDKLINLEKNMATISGKKHSTFYYEIIFE